MWGKWEDVKSEYESKVNDPWDWVTHFENAVARYTGAKHAIACDSASNAIKLCLNYVHEAKSIKIPKGSKMYIPANTYVSVPNQIILEGFIPVFQQKEWHQHYKIGSSGIIDAAVSFYENMYSETLIDGKEDLFMALSFHHRKIINIGRGGMILSNSDRFNEWARPMIYDGRKKYMNYEIDEFECVGWHMYMTPEEAQRGLEIFHDEKIKSINEPVGSWLTYKDLTKHNIFRKYDISKSIVSYNSNNDVILNNIRIKENTISDFLFNMKYHLTSKLSLPIIPQEWHNVFDKIDLKSFNDNVNFILYDKIECYSKYDNSDVIKLLKFIFKKYGMEDRIKIYGNNLSVTPENVNYYPTPFFLGDSSWQSKKINQRKFKKRFLFLSGEPKLHRCQIMKFLDDNDILDNTNYSWNPNNKSLPAAYRSDEIMNTPKTLDCEVGKLYVSEMHKIINEYYTSFVNIVAESYFYDGVFDAFNTNKKPIFITEKTEKNFSSATPFIIISTPHYLKKLKELGFKTFDKWWDESYDEIEHESKRLTAIKELILNINSWSDEKCEQIYREMIPILKHNQYLNFTFDAKHKKICSTRDIYLDNISKKIPHLDKYSLNADVSEIKLF
jgi:hypothetical protein